MTPIPLTKFRDERGTICIAQTGSEIPFDIKGVYYISRAVELKEFSNCTIIVVKGNLNIEIEERTVAILEDHCLFISDKRNISESSLSPGGLILVISHRDQTLNAQLSARFDSQLSIDDCNVYTAEENTKELIHHFMPDLQRVFYLKNINNGSDRGGHAHKYCHQALLCLSGKFDVLLNDGKVEKEIQLAAPQDILHLQPFIWAKQINFSEDAICLVLASHRYDRASYIDDIDILKSLKSEVYR